MISNKEIKNVLKKGLNFREKQPQNKDLALSSIQSGIDKFVEQARINNKLDIKLFSPWKKYILEEVTNILKDCSNTHPAYKVLNKQENKEFLHDFHEKFVVVPVDKAAKNVGIICKEFYLKVLKNELKDFGNFNEAIFTVDEILKNYALILKKCNYKIPNNKSLPFVYWIPKFHKTPTDFRFITSGRNTILNELSKIAGTGLKNMLKLEKTNCTFIHKFDGIRNYYVIDDNKDVINFMVESNLLNDNNKYLKTFDFKTLYSKIPHGKLKENIKKFISSVFAFKNRKYLNISYKSAQFADKSSKSGSFAEQEFIDLLIFIIDNCFISNGSGIERQIVGIPTGTNCASDIANIFLHVFEKNFVEKLVADKELEKLFKLGHVFRYQDDLISFGQCITEDNLFTDIYPTEMVIKNTNISEKHVTYLDLEIEVIGNRFIYKTYDKRNDFNFPIINYPNLRGNIPIKAAYGVFISQLVRYSSINLEVEDFIQDVKALVSKLVKQGYKQNLLVSYFKHFANKYITLWVRFGVDILNYQLINAIFD